MLQKLERDYYEKVKTKQTSLFGRLKQLIPKARPRTGGSVMTCPFNPKRILAHGIFIKKGSINSEPMDLISVLIVAT